MSARALRVARHLRRALAVHLRVRRLELQALQQRRAARLDARAQRRRRRRARARDLRLEANVLRLVRLGGHLRGEARRRERVGDRAQALVHAPVPGLHRGAVRDDVVVARRGERRVQQVIVGVRHHQPEHGLAALRRGHRRALAFEARQHAPFAGLDVAAQRARVLAARLRDLLVQTHVGVLALLVREHRAAAGAAHGRVVQLPLQAPDDAPAPRGDALAQRLRLRRALVGERVLEPPVAGHPHLALEQLRLARLGSLGAVLRQATPQAPLARRHAVAVRRELGFARQRQSGVLADVPRGGDHLLLDLRDAIGVVHVPVRVLALQALQHGARGAHLALRRLELAGAHGLGRARARLAQREVQAPVGGAAHDASIEGRAARRGELRGAHVRLEARQHAPLAGNDVPAEGALVRGARLRQKRVVAHVLRLLHLAPENLQLALRGELRAVVLQALLDRAAAPGRVRAQGLPVLLARERQRSVQRDVCGLLDLPEPDNLGARGLELRLVRLETSEHQP